MSTRTVTVQYVTRSDMRRRECNVSLTEGYSDESDIRAILAVKHYSSNSPESLALINVHYVDGRDVRPPVIRRAARLLSALVDENEKGGQNGPTPRFVACKLAYDRLAPEFYRALKDS